MKKPYVLFITIIGLALLLSACVPGPRVVGTPGISLLDDMVFVAYGNFVYGLDVDSGAVSWHFPDERDNQIAFYARPYVTDSYVYVGDLDNNFYKLDRETGRVVWTYSDARGYFLGQPVERDGVVYAPSNDGRVYALNAEGALLWEFETGHYVWAQPQIIRDMVIIGSMDHFVYAVSQEGEEIWATELNGAIVGTPALSDDGQTLYVGSIGQEMVAINTTDGSILWNFTARDSVWGRPILADNTVYFADSVGTLYALDPANGSQLWQINLAGAVVGGLVEIDDGFALGTSNGVVKAFNFDGSPKWESSISGEIYQSPAVMDQWLVIGTIEGDNLVYAYDLTGVQLWSTTPEN